ncbi:MAG: lytic transglycosylase domain-containing protein [Deltaproteobacteria bacterium]|nr:lytic transglycosylase domain-containing protein [Deltaproteobacteria bacterium]
MALSIRHVVILLFTLLLPIEAWGGIYVYVDKHGISHYTNVPADRRYHPLRQRKINDVPWPAQFTGNGKTSRVFNPAAANYDHHIRRAALSYSIDPLLLKAIIQTESDFNQYAVSRDGAQGLMQLMPKTARDMRVRNPFDAAQNINGGARYLKCLLNNYRGDLVRSLAAYNAGPGRISKDGPLPKIPETIAYVKRVIHLYRLYQERTAESRAGHISVRKLIKMN